jgi:hypothetical protein
MTTKQTVELERTDCGSYCTPDERMTSAVSLKDSG